jgi:uncharacterized protein
VVTPEGWRPTPFREFILKVHQRCNLACDYCYMYTKADQSWRSRPVAMPEAVRRAVAERIAEHVRRHGLRQVRLVLHGGEPFLLGAPALAGIVDLVRAAVPASCAVTATVQTNGVLLDRPGLDILRERGVSVGVSVDGTAADHDRHRRFADGRGSHAAVERALRLLGEPAYRPMFAGILCTIDLRTDPVAGYEELLRYAPPVVDFLLPHANWGSLPPYPAGAVSGSYAGWLVEVFDRWYRADPQETHVRLFEELINLILGGASRSEQVGLSPVALVVVDSDGAIEQVDSLKSTYPGAAGMRLNVLRDPFDAALAHPGVVARQIGVRALSSTCRTCPVHRVCGGGNYVHRYRPGAGFTNPSVYCADLRQLIEHITAAVGADLARLRGVGA